MRIISVTPVKNIDTVKNKVSGSSFVCSAEDCGLHKVGQGRWLSNEVLTDLSEDPSLVSHMATRSCQ